MYVFAAVGLSKRKPQVAMELWLPSPKMCEGYTHHWNGPGERLNIYFLGLAKTSPEKMCFHFQTDSFHPHRKYVHLKTHSCTCGENPFELNMVVSETVFCSRKNRCKSANNHSNVLKYCNFSIRYTIALSNMELV